MAASFLNPCVPLPPLLCRYWYNETSTHGKPGLFQDSALEDGFLQASNRHRMDFALMWASQTVRPGGNVALALSARHRDAPRRCQACQGNAHRIAHPGAIAI